MAILIHDIEVEIVNRFADRDVNHLIVNTIGGGKDGALRRSVGIVETIALRRSERSQFLATCREMVQGVVVLTGSKLIAHLCGHEGMGDMLTIEVGIEVGQGETDIIANDMNRSATGEGGVHIHHAGIKAV